MDSKTVLLVDDEDLVRNMVRRVLNMQGYNVIEFEDGKGALEGLAGFDNDIDLLLTDLSMPEMSGQELAKNVKKTNPNIRVLYMSGYTDGQKEDGDEKIDEESFIHKPFTIDSLAQKVRDTMNS